MAFYSPGEYCGALNPAALTMLERVTLALYGGFDVNIRTNCFSASLGFLVGGILIEILTSLKGSNTLPAPVQSGSPDVPMIAI